MIRTENAYWDNWLPVTLRPGLEAKFATVFDGIPEGELTPKPQCNCDVTNEASRRPFAGRDLPVLGWQELQSRGRSPGPRPRDALGGRDVRALEAAERPERPKLPVLEQLSPEQRRAEAVVEPDVGAPAEMRWVGWLNGMLVRLGNDRRG